MNKKQRTTLFIAAGVLLLMLLFPPFQLNDANEGYHFILNPPGVSTINSGALFVQVFIIVVQAFILFLALNYRERSNKTIGLIEKTARSHQKNNPGSLALQVELQEKEILTSHINRYESSATKAKKMAEETSGEWADYWDKKAKTNNLKVKVIKSMMNDSEIIARKKL